MTTYEEFGRAAEFFDARDFATAARLLAPIVAADPGNRAAVELLARAYFHSAQLSRAERAFRDLLDLDPGNGWAYEALARTLERSGRAAEAAGPRRMASAMGVGPTEEIEVAVTAADLA
ncbi:tetratricopeptide repeat protein [Actinomadura flavalba]|uniref:tetratricopeptide repeat protein n=1 Tax=Actinomadura flavalba TaxID=1120938 RepID=UPI0003716EF9|nr:tetratricopeptide repeat protein [Actinomadura flavalba]